MLSLIAAGPSRIFVASALQITNLRRQADTAIAQALAGADMGQRTTLAAQLEQLAQQAEQQPAAPWHDLATHLRTEAARLGDPSAAP